MKKLFVALISFCIVSSAYSQTQIIFNNLDSVLKYAENNSYSIKSGNEQLLLAKWEKISAQAAVVNFRVPTNFNLTDNIEQPVTFLPGEVFGGQPGTFKQVTTGQQYVANFNIAPQIDIINPANWAKLKSAKTNKELTTVNSTLNKKMLFESISAAYYNCVSLNEQIEITAENLLVADTLFLNMSSKYQEGIVRKQDLNDAEINKLSLVDKLEQLKLNLAQQYNNLKILCDIPEDTELIIAEELNDTIVFPETATVDNQLLYKQSVLKYLAAKSEVSTNWLMQLPTVSILYNNAWQQNSNDAFFDSNANWINSQYIGFRLTAPIPDFNRFTQTKIARFNANIAQQNAEHTKTQNNINNKQLEIDYAKALSQLESTKKILELKQENYQMSLNQFNQSVLSSDRLLIAFNDLLIAQLNYSNSLANIQHNLSKIEINNSVK